MRKIFAIYLLSVLFVTSINATDIPLLKDSLKQHYEEQEVLIKDTSVVESCNTSILTCCEGKTQAKDNDMCSQIIFLVLGAILGFLCSLAATALYNYLQKAKLSIDEHIAKVVGEDGKIRYSFLVANERNVDVINVEAEVAIVYIRNNHKFTHTIELVKNSTKCVVGKCKSNAEDSSYIFTIKDAEDFETRWEACQSDNNYENPQIRLRVVAYHALSGLVSFVQKEFTQEKIQDGMFKDRRFIATKSN